MMINFPRKYLPILLLPYAAMGQSLATPVPTEAPAVPATPAPVPVPATPAPVTATSAPTKATSAPTKATSAPTKATPAPTKATLAPVPATPAPTSAPVVPGTTPAPVPATSAPTKATPAPTKATSAPTKVTPAPVPTTPAPTKATSAPSIVASAVPTLSPSASPTAKPIPAASASPSSQSFFESRKFIETFSYELFFRPAWSNAIVRTFMGWNPDTASVLSSYIPEDGTTTPKSMAALCKDTIGGTSFGKHDHQCISTSQKWTQLTNGVPGEASMWFGDMSTVCKELGGHSLGEKKQLCAVEGEWSQLYSEKMYLDTGNSYGLKKYCEMNGGTMFGQNHFCALEGVYSQFSTKLPGDDVNGVQTMKEACTLMGGFSFDHYCLIKGAHAQLTTKLPGDAYFPSSLRNVCNDLGGTNFGPYCGVKGVYTQFTSELPGHRGKPTTLEGECKRLGGRSFDHFCVVQGSYTQLINKVPGNTESHFDGLKLICSDDVMGEYFTGSCGVGSCGVGSCGVKGNFTQISTRFPFAEEHGDVYGTCRSLSGFGIDNLCVAEGNIGSKESDMYEEKGGSNATLIGIIFGLVGIVILCFVAYLTLKRRSQNQNERENLVSDP